MFLINSFILLLMFFHTTPANNRLPSLMNLLHINFAFKDFIYYFELKNNVFNEAYIK